MIILLWTMLNAVRSTENRDVSGFMVLGNIENVRSRAIFFNQNQTFMAN